VFLGGTLEDFVTDDGQGGIIHALGGFRSAIDDLDHTVPELVVARLAQALGDRGCAPQGIFARLCAAHGITLGQPGEGPVDDVDAELGGQHSQQRQAPPHADRGGQPPEGRPSLAWVLAEARRNASQDRHAEAFRACLQWLSGPEPALQALDEIVSSWERAERKCLHKYEDEHRALMAQLMDARDRTAALRHQREAKDAELFAERQRCREAKDEARELRRQLLHANEVLKENARLKQQIRSGVGSKAPAPSRDEVVRQLAKLECAPLRDCAPEELPALRKKLLLKWHPDKQPSADHGRLATQVMQELQNRTEWSY